MDQADRLRELVQHANASERNGASAPLLVVNGGKGGVGATTVAVHLSTTLARRGLEVVLVDADLQQPDATILTGIESETDNSLADVLSGGRTAAEVLRNGPAGVRVLPGSWAPRQMPDLSRGAKERLLAELGRLRRRAHVLVVDAGCGLSPWSERLWRQASFVLAVTTADQLAVMDTYAMLKLAACSSSLAYVRLLVNQCDSEAVADQVHQRIGQASFRFLGELVAAVPYIPRAQFAGSAGAVGSGCHPDAAFAASLDQIAGYVSGELNLTSRTLSTTAADAA